eukprot:scaffold20321_cov32-Prasinocladus_malaysianus.AAC.1
MKAIPPPPDHLVKPKQSSGHSRRAASRRLCYDGGRPNDATRLAFAFRPRQAAYIGRMSASWRPKKQLCA